MSIITKHIKPNTVCCDELRGMLSRFSWFIVDIDGEPNFVSPNIDGKIIKYCPYCGRNITCIELKSSEYQNVFGLKLV